MENTHDDGELDMTFDPIWYGDSLTYTCTVQTGGAGKDLTGATVEASAQSGDGKLVNGTATLSDAAGGVVSVSFGRNDLVAGTWGLFVRVTLGGEVQTHKAGEISIRPAVF